jgi:hypothetical protein
MIVNGKILYKNLPSENMFFEAKNKKNGFKMSPVNCVKIEVKRSTGKLGILF